jgi:mono/diheme cytochrome c family protein
MVVKLFFVAIFVIGLNAACWAENFDAGKIEYEIGCAPCHGVDGKGSGPVAAGLTATPADLTVLAKKNNGVFRHSLTPSTGSRPSSPTAPAICRFGVTDMHLR